MIFIEQVLVCMALGVFVVTCVTYPVLAVPPRGPQRDQSAENAVPIALAGYLCDQSTVDMSNSESWYLKPWGFDQCKTRVLFYQRCMFPFNLSP
jgi:hypothetical protein